MMKISRVYKYLFRLTSHLRSRLIIRNIGYLTIIRNPLCINGAKSISIGSKTIIEYKSWIAAMPLTGDSEVELLVGNHCSIGHFNEIYATKSIIIEDKVLTADRVYISDNLHGYTNPMMPVIDQPIKQLNSVRIGEGSWLGVGVAVIGANIGKHCVIGSNAVVTKDIPDYSVAVGIPAKVIKRYNFETEKWEKTNPDGSFLEN